MGAQGQVVHGAGAGLEGALIDARPLVRAMLEFKLNGLRTAPKVAVCGSIIVFVVAG